MWSFIHSLLKGWWIFPVLHYYIRLKEHPDLFPFPHTGQISGGAEDEGNQGLERKELVTKQSKTKRERGW
jgi:hypothetical protein